MKSVRPISTCIFLVFLSFLINCSPEDEEIRSVPVKGNYYPMIPGSQWKYVQQSVCNWPDSSKICYDTMTYVVGGDIWESDPEFKPVSASYGTVKWIKVKGNQYSSMGAYIPTYMFLDTNKALNESWSCTSQYIQDDFTVISVNDIMI